MRTVVHVILLKYSSVYDFINVRKRAFILKDLEEHISLGHFNGSILRIRKRDMLHKI